MWTKDVLCKEDQWVIANCFIKYILLTIVMNSASKLPSPTHSTLFTREEIFENGCCFPLFARPRQQSIQSHAAPRNQSETKHKKIDLVITKRGLTQEKEMRRVLKQTLRAKPTFIVELKQLELVPSGSSQSSKVTTQKNSLKNSRKKLEAEGRSAKLTLSNRYEKYIGVKEEDRKRLVQVTFNQTKAENTNIQLLSEISYVEEQFISHQSTTLRALHIFQSQEKQRSELTPARHLRDSPLPKPTEASPDAPNPLQRLLDKKRGSKAEPSRPRLVL